MSTDPEKLQRLRRFNAWVRREDPELVDEAESKVQDELLEAAPAGGDVENAVELESIILRETRPVLAIRDNRTVLRFIEDTDSEIWKERLTRAEPMLDRAIRAIGRIELTGGRLDWVGTGWLVHDNILVTNRHVAVEFAARKGNGFVFRMGNSGPMAASVDFLEEIDNPASLTFRLLRPLFIQEDPGPDVAFFEVDIASGNQRIARPIALSRKPAPTENVATIGYPAADSRIPDRDLMERIYGSVYNKKRLAPGGVTRVERSRILHNCTTLGGNSGSAVVDLDSGEAVGLHFSGSFLTTNYAVRSDVVQKLLAAVRGGRIRPEAQPAPSAPPPHPQGRTTTSACCPADSGSVKVQIPLTISISLGKPCTVAIPPRRARPGPALPHTDSADVSDTEEAAVADYDDRQGYQPAFLGRGFEIELPTVERHADDVLELDAAGGGTELRYEHFSVVMSQSRRMCFLSAVNIDGNQAKKTKRVAWKWDPRIPRTQQIMKECYGDPPRFSRGHMTRREDPAWGGASQAKRGNEDSMHVTNATPQMQAFNAPIWLALEDYALGHAKEDDMKISVFTGPYFAQEDPEMYGVRIPVAFWKVIAFLHDETGELCATGYEMNQEASLQPEEEFVFGQFTSPQLGVATQVSIRSIEQRSGISFNGLAEADPLAGDQESVAAEGRVPLGSLEQIRFV